MSIRLSDIPYSVLDLSIVTENHTMADAIHNSRDLAQHVESFGYNRFWMAEHHNMANIASSATSVLLGYIAEATSTIRVGSGGIMLPNHSPLIIAEHFGTLETLYPGRVDLGLGRAPGTDPETASAIRPDRINQVRQFPESVRLLQSYFSEATPDQKVKAIPGQGTNIPLWILGSSTDSAFLAAELGLPYAFASHFAPQQLFSAIEIYRENFKPSKQLSEPYVMVGVNIIAAESDEDAQYLFSSMKAMYTGVVTGDRQPLPPPGRVDPRLEIDYVQMAIEPFMRCTFVGSKETIREKISGFLQQTGAYEVVMTSYIYDHTERIKSHRLFAEVMRE